MSVSYRRTPGWLAVYDAAVSASFSTAASTAKPAARRPPVRPPQPENKSTAVKGCFERAHTRSIRRKDRLMRDGPCGGSASRMPPYEVVRVLPDRDDPVSGAR